MERIKARIEPAAWKIVCHWVKVQVSMILLEHAELAEVFIPDHYHAESDRTLYERVKGGKVKLIDNI
ncbi:hypothetical protein [Membranihabitans maritimus]|uniref:hypothetical protein n=1 Tax=Membranihabitans maritimus TaxID=2904244 RepID=UPI001F47CFAF|nr:hypothetical protein [Membranihabitans maritimus]